LILANGLAWYFNQFLLLNLLASCFYIVWHSASLVLFIEWQNSNDKNSFHNSLGIWNYFVQTELSNQYKVKKNQIKYKNILSQLEITTKAFPDATILINDKGQILWSNDSALSLLGVSERDIGVKITEIIIDDRFREFLEKPNNKSLELSLSNNYNITLNIKLINYNRNQNLLIARDVSQQLQLQQTRRAFIANASHELRTPLTVITGYLEILQSQSEVYKENKMPLDSAIEQAARMNLIIDDLLELSKIEQSKIMQSDKDVVNLAKILSLLLNDLKPLTSKKKFKINASFDSEIEIKSNKNQMQSLVENLIKNAINHNPDGTNLDIYWQLDKMGRPSLTVKDNGCGIPEEHLEHITERFYRVANENSVMTQGTGLGLAIVKHIAMFHDAELFIDSKLGMGTKVIIKFPQSRLDK
jgi:two-component system phosphate regulon sensor histidine kinase PhoR